MTLYLLLLATLVTCVEGTYSHYYRHRQPDHAAQVREHFMMWNSRAAAQNIDGMVALYTDDLEVDPPNLPPIFGKTALKQYYQDILDAGRWPLDRVLTFDSFLAKCGNLLLARYTGRTTRFDGTKSVTNGLRIFRKENGMLKLKYAIFNSNGPVTSPAPAMMRPQQQPSSGQGSYGYHG